MSNDETFPATITTIDQNTRHPIAWDVLNAMPREGGFTHTLFVARPKGRKMHIMNVKMVNGELVSHDRPTSLMGFR